MWEARRTPFNPEWSEHVVIASRGQTLTFRDVIDGWSRNESFREFFISLLAATEFSAFFWETPPIFQRRTDMPYEHVAIRSDALARLTPRPDAFERPFRTSGDEIASFRNLGGDALLIAPKPLAAWDAYGHLGAFLRSAPVHQRHELFRVLGRSLGHVLRICDDRLWISTAGLGVPWLHVRLDSFPKYYNHRPYAER